MAHGLLDTDLGRRLLAASADAGLELASVIDGDEATLRPTEIAQPALLLTELVLAAALPPGLDIVGLAGHSVGEYAACVTAGALAPETAMRVVVERGRQMAAMREGTMAAVIGLDSDAVERACAQVPPGLGVVVVANLNGPGQVVISGSAAAVAATGERCREAGARRILALNVSGAFHSPLMAEAAQGFAATLDAAALSDARTPVVCNVDAAAVTEATELRARLRRQLVSPVRWVDVVLRLHDLGADTLVEVGPGSVLCGLARRIAPELTTVSITTVEAAAGAAETLAATVGA